MFQRIRKALAEAAEVDGFHTRLRLTTDNNADRRSEVFEAALLVAQSGISLEELQDAIQAQAHEPFFPRTREDAMNGDTTRYDAATSNELAGIVIDMFPEVHVPFSVRYGIAHAVMDAGYTKRSVDAEGATDRVKDLRKHIDAVLTGPEVEDLSHSIAQSLTDLGYTDSIARAGFTEDEAWKAFRQWRLQPDRTRYELDMVRRYLDARIQEVS